MTQEGKTPEGETPRLTLKEALKQYLATQKFEVRTVLGPDGRRRRFFGVWLATYDTQWLAGREQNRWDEWNLYALKSGRYLLAHAYYTRWQGEVDQYDYVIFNSFDEIDDQDVLDNLRDRLCKELNVKIPLADVAVPLEGEEI